MFSGAGTGRVGSAAVAESSAANLSASPVLSQAATGGGGGESGFEGVSGDGGAGEGSYGYKKIVARLPKKRKNLLEQRTFI
jgi:hypothetical protein